MRHKDVVRRLAAVDHLSTTASCVRRVGSHHSAVNGRSQLMMMMLMSSVIVLVQLPQPGQAAAVLRIPTGTYLLIVLKFIKPNTSFFL